MQDFHFLLHDMHDSLGLLVLFQYSHIQINFCMIIWDMSTYKHALNNNRIKIGFGYSR